MTGKVFLSARASLVTTLLASAMVATACARESQSPATVAGTDIAVYTLSRGTGVPEDARKAMTTARELFERMRAEQRVIDVIETRMGLEGERRLCARFVSADHAARAMTELRAIAAGIDLFNVVSEPCRQEHANGEQS